jgi:hypothetical protein
MSFRFVFGATDYTSASADCQSVLAAITPRLDSIYSLIYGGDAGYIAYGCSSTVVEAGTTIYSGLRASGVYQGTSATITSMVEVADPSSLLGVPPAELGSVWTAFFGLTLLCWLLGKMLGTVVKAVKEF